MLKIIDGNGQASYLLLQQHFMFFSIHSIISFSRPMYGFFQIVFYFGYMGLFSIALGVMCGTFGYVGTRYFVTKIYSTVKID